MIQVKGAPIRWMTDLKYHNMSKKGPFNMSKELSDLQMEDSSVRHLQTKNSHFIFFNRLSPICNGSALNYHQQQDDNLLQ